MKAALIWDQTFLQRTASVPLYSQRTPSPMRSRMHTNGFNLKSPNQATTHPRQVLYSRMWNLLPQHPIFRTARNLNTSLPHVSKDSDMKNFRRKPKSFSQRISITALLSPSLKLTVSPPNPSIPSHILPKRWATLTIRHVGPLTLDFRCHSYVLILESTSPNPILVVLTIQSDSMETNSLMLIYPEMAGALDMIK